MKIAVIGLYYATNLGDAVICDCVAKWFYDAYPNAQVDVIDITGSNCFEEESSVSLRTLRRRQWNLCRDYWLTRHGFEDKVYFWSNKNMEQHKEFYGQVADREYDIAIFAGGQLFMDWLALYICEFVKQFQRVGTLVYFNACGVGVSVSPKIKEKLGKYLNVDVVKFISSRDDVDKIKKRYLKDDKEVFPTYDPALWTKETYGIKMNKNNIIEAGEVCDSKIEMKKDTTLVEEKLIGLGVMHCSHISAKKLIRFWCGVVKELERRQIPWKMFCNGAMDDYNLCRYILEKLHLEEEKYLCPCAKFPKQLVEQIAGFKGLISFRLHSHIIAASYEIPAVALVWDEKLRFFYRHLNHEERCMTVKSSAFDVVSGLERALEEGYERSLLEQQKEYAKNLLLGALGTNNGMW